MLKKILLPQITPNIHSFCHFEIVFWKYGFVFRFLIFLLILSAVIGGADVTDDVKSNITATAKVHAAQ